MNQTIHIINLLAFQANVRLAHWQSPTLSGNLHRIWGKLYAAIDDKIDYFAEVLLGKLGTREIDVSAVMLNDHIDVKELIDEGISVVEDAIYEFSKDEGNEDLINILAEIKAAINHAKYHAQL
jgi:DNA-binding ferritin-like protein